jgi:hypothetical protein
MSQIGAAALPRMRPRSASVLMESLGIPGAVAAAAPGDAGFATLETSPPEAACFGVEAASFRAQAAAETSIRVLTRRSESRRDMEM